MVFQNCIQRCSSAQLERLAQQIIKDCLVLSRDTYGNYIVQTIIKKHDFEYNQQFFTAFLPHLVTLCTTKFSSPVIECVSAS